jgi:hypothetical protein
LNAIQHLPTALSKKLKANERLRFRLIRHFPYVGIIRGRLASVTPVPGGEQYRRPRNDAVRRVTGDVFADMTRLQRSGRHQDKSKACGADRRRSVGSIRSAAGPLNNARRFMTVQFVLLRAG